MAILMVVATHALAYTSLPPGTTRLIANLVQPIAVPAFFFVDGLLFGYKNAPNRQFNHVVYLKKSTSRLLLPWLIFSGCFTVLRGLAEYAGHLPVKVVYEQPLGDVLHAVYTSSISAQMYFLLSLFLIRTCSRASMVITSCPLHIRIICFVIYYLAFQTVDLRPYFLPGFDPVLHALWGLQFYLLGLALHSFAAASPKPLPLTPVLACLFGGLAGALLNLPFLFSQPLLLIGSFALFRSAGAATNTLAAIGRRTMGIFLLHMPLVMKPLQYGLSRLTDSDSMTHYLALTCSTAGFSFILAKWIASLPYGGLLFGELRSNDHTSDHIRTRHTQDQA
jgi:fucose 4-O-acetylase-like acetyltransferase